MERKKIKIAVIMAHGGLGDFLFQLDLAKRLQYEDIKTVFLFRKNIKFLSDILNNSGLSAKKIIRGDGWRYITASCYVWIMGILYFKRTAIINSFHFEFLRFPTKVLYKVFKILSGRVIVCKKEFTENLTYEQINYLDGEVIWSRNNRIVSYVIGKNINIPFPAINFSTSTDPGVFEMGYIHIHPVGSLFEKSYPAKKLLSALKIIGEKENILITMTPKEELWYMTDELNEYIKSKSNIKLISKFFPFSEIINHINNSKVFCTVNTGVLWVAIFLGKKIVVCDTYTDLEWNPLPYGDIIRLSHDYDEHGNSLHLLLKKHEDGTYYESMYKISGEEFAEAVKKAI